MKNPMTEHHRVFPTPFEDVKFSIQPRMRLLYNRGFYITPTITYLFSTLLRHLSRQGFRRFLVTIRTGRLFVEFPVFVTIGASRFNMYLIQFKPDDGMIEILKAPFAMTGIAAAIQFADPLSLRMTRMAVQTLMINGQGPAGDCRVIEPRAFLYKMTLGAFEKTELGAVVYHSDKCIGCRYSMVACPFSVPKYQWDKRLPFVQKCILCYDRVKDGQLPACSKACPTEATLFGDREKLLNIAEMRILKNPEKYVPHI